MGKVKVELNSAGVRELLKSREMLAICHEHAQRAANTLGAGYEVTDYHGKTRVNVSIAAVSGAAKRENLENNSILKALGR